MADGAAAPDFATPAARERIVSGIPRYQGRVHFLGLLAVELMVLPVFALVWWTLAATRPRCRAWPWWGGSSGTTSGTTTRGR